MVAGKEPAEKKFAGWIGLAGIFFCALIYWAIPEPVVAVRPLDVEEREIVISVLGRIEANSVAQVIGLEDFSEQFIASGVPAYVDHSVKRNALVEGDADLMRFSPAFFAAESEAQRQALKKLVIPDPPLTPGEVAVTGKAE